jgi:mannose-6-phosphate isomerase-like protein (cupin superfamily)
MTILSCGAAVIEDGPLSDSEGVRRFRVPISRAMGARDIAQTISQYSRGFAPTRRNPEGEEVLYVVSGAGDCYIDGHRYRLEPGVGVYIPPSSICQIGNTAELDDHREQLNIVSVCCPEDFAAESNLSPVVADPRDTTPFRTVREELQPAIPAGDRSFRLLINRDVGCRRVTQFTGLIPPGRAPMHHHPYEEAIYILEGEGRVWIEEDSAAFGPGTSIYLPRGVTHCLENTGRTNVRLLGVFHPSGSPGEAYEE